MTQTRYLALSQDAPDERGATPITIHEVGTPDWSERITVEATEDRVEWESRADHELRHAGWYRISPWQDDRCEVVVVT